LLLTVIKRALLVGKRFSLSLDRDANTEENVSFAGIQSLIIRGESSKNIL